eukprot:1354433-Lingulodinium_polyedra.AAC.1
MAGRLDGPPVETARVAQHGRGRFRPAGARPVCRCRGAPGRPRGGGGCLLQRGLAAQHEPLRGQEASGAGPAADRPRRRAC